MPWVIEHQPARNGRPHYWTGWGFDPDAKKSQMARWDEDLNKALQFDTEEEAQVAYRGDYRPETTCCNPVEVY